MIKKNADTQSGTDAGTSTNTRAMQRRTGRIKQIRRLREKSTMTLRSVASVAGAATDNAKAPKQARLRQLKAVKQLAVRLPKSVGQPVDATLALARPMQFRQICARKTIRAAIRVGGTGLASEPLKTALARTAQLRQLGAKKKLSLKAEAR